MLALLRAALVTHFAKLQTPDLAASDTHDRAIRQGYEDSSLLSKLIPEGPNPRSKDLFPKIEIGNLIWSFSCDSKQIDQQSVKSRSLIIKEKLADINSAIDKMELPADSFKDRIKEIVTDLSKIYKLNPNKQIGKINEICHKLSELKDDLVKVYFSELENQACTKKEQIAGLIARSIPADELSLQQARTLLKYTRSPLSAVSDLGNIISIHYSKELMLATLGSENFEIYASSKFRDLPQDTKKKLQLLMYRRRDTYSDEALELLISGNSANPDKKDVNQTAIAAILAFRKDLIDKHKLTGLFIQHLPFTAEQNGQLIQAVCSHHSTSIPDKMIDQVFKGNEILHDPENVRTLYKIEDEIKAKQIALLAKLFKQRAEEIAAAEGSRYII